MDKGAAYESVVVGLGRTGLSCARYLARRGHDFAVVDSRKEPPQLQALRAELPETPVFPGGFDADMFRKAGRLIVSPGVALSEPAIRAAAAAGVEIIGDIELFCRETTDPVAAITGSNGKSTVAKLLGEMAAAAGIQARLGANFGTPALDMLEGPRPDWFVFELSSFQLETTSSMDAAVAAVINLSPDHMDRYPDLDAYAAAKQRIYRGSGTMIINLDDPLVAAMREPGRRTVSFGRAEAAEVGVRNVDGEPWIARGGSSLIPVSELPLAGDHNLLNALGAVAVATAMELPSDAIGSTLRAFRGLPHRCQLVADHGGVRWYNDSKGTNVGATCAAISGIATSDDVILIAGGLGKGADFAPLADAARGRVRCAILIGRDANALAAVLEPVVPVCFATGLEAAVMSARDMAQPGDRVLLSPACASLDMFRDYQERGERFEAAVNSLVAGGSP